MTDYQIAALPFLTLLVFIIIMILKWEITAKLKSKASGRARAAGRAKSKAISGAPSTKSLMITDILNGRNNI